MAEPEKRQGAYVDTGAQENTPGVEKAIASGLENLLKCIREWVRTLQKANQPKAIDDLQMAINVMFEQQRSRRQDGK